MDVVDHPQAHVRQRTHGERHPLTDEALDERGVVESIVAMVDAGSVEQVKRVARLVCGTFLPGMGNRQHTLGASPVEDFAELPGWVTLLSRIEAHSDDPVAAPQRMFQCGHGLVGVAVAQEARD